MHWAILLTFVTILPSTFARAEDIPAIAAAADLQSVLPEVAEAFQEETGQRVRFSFGSSGNFSRQIAQGAPFDVFMSADEAYVLALQQAGLAVDKGVIYGLGRLVIFASHGAPLAPDADLKGLAEALADGKIQRFAIAHPEHAPYGRAAREALIRAGLWEAIQKRLVLGENAAQAAQFALSGSAQGGIIPYSLALDPAISARGRFALLPLHTHSPLRQRMVLLKDASPTARRFYAFVQGPLGRRILERYGFDLPDGGKSDNQACQAVVC